MTTEWTPYEVSVITEIARHHRLSGEPRLMPSSGMVNEAWAIGDEYVLRIIREEDCDDEAERESLVVPLVRAAGVQTPELVAFDLSCTRTQKPYTIYRRAPGVLLGEQDDDPKRFSAVYRQLGRDIALIGSVQVPDSLRPKLRSGSRLNTASKVREALDAGKIDASHRRELLDLTENLESQLGKPGPSVLMHRDLHPWNFLVDLSAPALTAIIDWGDAAWGDPAMEFASMPLIAMPEMLAGYEDAGGEIDDAFVARALYIGLGLAVWEDQDLDPARFLRQWWRLSQGGWSETVALIRNLLDDRISAVVP